MAFCGDETAALIGDVGTATAKFGFAGEDHPKCVLPSVVGVDQEPACYHVGDTALRHRGPSLALESPLEGSRIVKWDLVEQLWEYAVGYALNSKPEEHPLLVCCNTAEPAGSRAKYVELLFEKLRPPCLFLAPNAMLSAFASGRPTALVVDFGGGSTCVAPVSDGFVLRKPLRESRVSGEMVDTHLLALIEQRLQRSLEVPAASQRRRSDSGNVVADEPSYMRWARREVVRDLKHATCRLWTETTFDEAAANSYIPSPYELPDGTVLTMAADRFRSSELLIKPPAASAGLDPMETVVGAPGTAPASTPSCSSVPHVGVHQLICDSVLATGVELRRTMLQHVRPLHSRPPPALMERPHNT